MRAALALVLLPMLLGGCDLSMSDQARTQSLDSETLWPGGPKRAMPPDGTVAQSQPAREAALRTPPPLTEALLDRGQQRYEIYCSVCHGETGDGDGKVAQRGFPHPPSYHSARLRQAPPGYIVQVITNGYGVMYSYADRVAPRDRWAIAAYVKALQRAREDERTREGAK